MRAPAPHDDLLAEIQTLRSSLDYETRKRSEANATSEANADLAERLQASLDEAVALLRRLTETCALNLEDQEPNDIIACTVVQKPFQFGYLSSKWMHELATKPDVGATIPADKNLDTGVEVINKANVAEFRAKLAEMKK